MKILRFKPSLSSVATHGSGSSMSPTTTDDDSIIRYITSSHSLDNVQLGGPSVPITPTDEERLEGGSGDGGESAKGKAKTSSITDEDFARSLYAEEALAHFEELSRSMYAPPTSETERALQRLLDDQAAFHTEQMISDLAATLRPLQIGDRDPQGSRASRDVILPVDEPEIAVRPALPARAIIANGMDMPIPFSWPPPRDERSGEPQQPICSVCRCPIEGKVVRLDCGSKYDMDCLKRMFEANVDDEYRFPPRCCGQVVPLSMVENQLSQETRDLYRAKIAEYSTPWRLYCSNATCARFLGSRQRKVVSTTCFDCSAETCALCTAPAHSPSQKCQIDKDMRKALKLGQSHGWQRCPRCRQLVERNDGCYHMSCRCGAQFCYLCADNWGRCKCWQRKRAFVKIVLFRWLHLRGNYLVNEEPAASTGNAVTRLCRRSWKSVKKAVNPASGSASATATVDANPADDGGLPPFREIGVAA